MISLIDHRIVLVAGSGGVGKTTLSAALAVRFASLGFDTLVLTVDPARRLAQALGIDSPDGETTEVPLAAKGKLWASQLKSARVLDSLIERITANADQLRRIRENPLYEAVCSSLSGSHEYAAIERILEFVLDRRFSKIVVDTPPTESAVDLLSAPSRMMEFMDSSVSRWFMGKGRFLSGLFHRGAQLVLKALRLVLGSDFFESFQRLMNDIQGLERGFKERNSRLLETLRSPECAFVLATIATGERLEEARQFQHVLQKEGIALRAIWINQLEEPAPELPGDSFCRDPALSAWHDHQRRIHERQSSIVENYKSFGLPVVSLPCLDTAPSRLADLSLMGERLIE